MNLTDLQNRLAMLQSEQQQLQQQFTSMGANISAYNGAIQECQYWINAFKAPVPVPAPVETNDTDTGDIVSFS
jgi:hypothetical protein